MDDQEISISETVVRCYFGISDATHAPGKDGRSSCRNPAKGRRAAAINPPLKPLPAHSGATAWTRSLASRFPSLIHLATPEFGIRQIAYRTENAGAIMADAYARISHKIGIASRRRTGRPPPFWFPALAEALTASVPVVALVQDVALENFDRNAFQELDHLRLFGGCCKWLRRVHSPDRIEDYVDMAFAAAAGGRPGPAVLLCPYDLIGAPTAPSSGRSASLGTYPLDRMVADPANIDAAAELLATAERPLVVAGGGVHLSDATAELALLQESCSLPVATTTMGKGAVDERHPLVRWELSATSWGRVEWRAISAVWSRTPTSSFWSIAGSTPVRCRSLLSADLMGRYYANSGQRRRSSKLTARQQGFTGDSAALEADVTPAPPMGARRRAPIPWRSASFGNARQRARRHPCRDGFRGNSLFVSARNVERPDVE